MNHRRFDQAAVEAICVVAGLGALGGGLILLGRRLWPPTLHLTH